MRLPTLLRSRTVRTPGIIGIARMDKRTRSLRGRLRRGDIAIIDHVDIDRAAAELLVDAGVAVVLNLAPSISGRYPNLGPAYLLDAGVLLVDQVDPDVFAAVNDGEAIRVDGGNVYRDEILVGSGVVQTKESVAAAFEAAKDGIATQMAAFSANAVEHLKVERALLTDGEGIPRVRTSIARRHVVVVSKAFDHRRELRALRSYIREHSPVLIGVDGGADALLDAGHRPDMVVADVENTSDRALRSGAELVVHTGRRGPLAGSDRLDQLGLTHATFVADCTAHDAALLLAHHAHADLIVTVGTPSSLIEFFDRGRSAMASSFLTQLAVSGDLIDAKALAVLYQHRMRGWWVLLLLLICVAVVAGAILTTPVGQDWYDHLHDWSVQGYDWARGRM
jgi:uncharacterized membrane-anchored protein